MQDAPHITNEQQTFLDLLKVEDSLQVMLAFIRFASMPNDWWHTEQRTLALQHGEEGLEQIRGLRQTLRNLYQPYWH